MLFAPSKTRVNDIYVQYPHPASKSNGFFLSAITPVRYHVLEVQVDQSEISTVKWKGLPAFLDISLVSSMSLLSKRQLRYTFSVET